MPITNIFKKVVYPFWSFSKIERYKQFYKLQLAVLTLLQQIFYKANFIELLQKLKQQCCNKFRELHLEPFQLQ